MPASPKYCECGRKIVVPVRKRMQGGRVMAGRAARKGRLPKHDLCRACWKALGLGRLKLGK